MAIRVFWSGFFLEPRKVATRAKSFTILFGLRLTGTVTAAPGDSLGELGYPNGQIR